ncbi:MAG: Asd/ArgC dimerization domain-containing protein [Myxococcota bacterium]
MGHAGLSIGVYGATGGLGSELLAVLGDSALQVGSLRAIATDASLGRDVEFQGESIPVETETRGLVGLDLVFCCAPPEASTLCVREALRAEVACIDCSGAMAGSPEVPLRIAALGEPIPSSAPLLAAPADAALAWAPVLAALHAESALSRLAGTALEGASVAGRKGIDALYKGSLALFNQEDLPEDENFGPRLAFDCLPGFGPRDEAGGSERERVLVGGLRRLLRAEFPMSVASVHVPVFLGHGAHLVVEGESEWDAKRVADCLARAPGVDAWGGDAEGPTLRAGAGHERVIVGRIQVEAESPRSLQLWLVGDLLRLAARNAVELASVQVAPKLGK